MGFSRRIALLAMLCYLAITMVMALFAVCYRCFPEREKGLTENHHNPIATVYNSVLCNQLKLSSDHPFVPIKRSPGKMAVSLVSSSHTERNLSLNLKFGQYHSIPYFLLPGPLTIANMCSSNSGAFISFLRHHFLFGKRLNVTHAQIITDLNNFGTEDNTEGNWKGSSDDLKNNTKTNQKNATGRSKEDVTYLEIPTSSNGNVDCEFKTNEKPFRVMITEAGYYSLLIHHNGPAPENYVRIQLSLNGFTARGTGDIDDCIRGLPTFSCRVPLDFWSEYRVDIQAPTELYGLPAPKMRFCCSPRFTLFHVLFISAPTTILMVIFFIECFQFRSTARRSQLKELLEVHNYQYQLHQKSRDDQVNVIFENELVLSPSDNFFPQCDIERGFEF